MNTKPANNHTVLWADDDVDDLLIMREILEQYHPDHKVVEAGNGQQVLQYLAALKHPSEFPCLIVLDMNMPVLNGRQTLALIRKEKRFDIIPVVVFTTSGAERDRSYCKALGAEMYTKPSSLADLEKAVGKLLDHCNKPVEHPEQAPAGNFR